MLQIFINFLFFLKHLKDEFLIKYYTLSTLYYLRRNERKQIKRSKRIKKLKPIFFRDYTGMDDEKKKAEKKTKVD
jgi:hypothetical protein